MKRHEDKVAVCVGSATGIGAECAYRLAVEGARVVIGDVNIDAARELVERIASAGGVSSAMSCDITMEDQVNALIEAAVTQHGGLDLMHVNAADLVNAEHDGDAVSTDLAIFDHGMAVGLRGHLLCTRAAVPMMQRRGCGAILYTSSDAAKLAGPSMVTYYVSKAALNGLMRHVAARWGREGIRANSVCPGLVLTDASRRIMSDEEFAGAVAAIPSTRPGEVTDVAALASFLLSDEAEWINGQAISINGGTVSQGG